MLYDQEEARREVMGRTIAGAIEWGKQAQKRARDLESRGIRIVRQIQISDEQGDKDVEIREEKGQYSMVVNFRRICSGSLAECESAAMRAGYLRRADCIRETRTAQNNGNISTGSGSSAPKQNKQAQRPQEPNNNGFSFSYVGNGRGWI